MTTSTPTIMIMAGGTGGHVFPGLAVAQFLREQGWRVVWMGVPGAMESRLVPPHGFEMAWVRAVAARGQGLLAALFLPTRLLLAFWQSARVLLRVQPDVVLGMGGYVAFPGGMMAALLNRPLAVHEQNSVAGLTNRLLAHVADCVMVAFPNAIRRALCTGNPVRVAITTLATPEVRYAARNGPLNILVLGGSLGAQALNTIVPQALALLAPAQRPVVVHQSGERHLAQLQANYAHAGVQATCVAFIDEMATAYAQADLVICRAGALTVAELAAAGVPALFVPFPHAVDDHQTANAKYLVDAGAAQCIAQSELTPTRLAAYLSGLNRTLLLQMAQRARGLGQPNATRDVAQACIQLMKERA